MEPTTPTLHPDLLTSNDKAALSIRNNGRSGYFALGIDAVLLVLAFWFPQVVALLIAAIWMFWLIYSIRLRSE